MLSQELVLSLLINGLITGSIYALVAIGLTLIFGILHVVNFAHGEFYAIGGYIGLVLTLYLGIPFFAALPLVLIIVALFGIATEYLAFRPLRGRSTTDTIISSFGLAIALQNAFLLIFGAQPAIIRTELASKTFSIAGVFMTVQRAIIPITALVLVLLFHVVLTYTWMGRALRAVSQNPSTAAVMGINVNRVASSTFALGAALAAGAGLLMSTIYMLQPTVGSLIALKAFTVVILGGLGNVYGAAMAGLLLGVVESFTAGFVSNEARDIIGFVMVIVVLMILPNGLFSFGRSYDRS